MKNKDLDFESSFQRLNEIVSVLESGSASLEQSLQLFEEGMKLIEFSRKQLADAEERVRTLIKTEDGFREEPGVK
ncbi:MAG: exodeoxyribonuclease VII small subunit [FCB group bacterium]|nr:exodeoxyribonuclease VII small subunit [FCB group bacterium]